MRRSSDPQNDLRPAVTMMVLLLVLPILIGVPSVFAAKQRVGILPLAERPVRHMAFPFNRTVTHFELKTKAEIRFRLAKGEAEGALILIDGGGATKLTVDFSRRSDQGLDNSLFYVKEVSIAGGLSVPDAMVPLSPGDSISVPDNGSFFVYARVSALYNTPVGDYRNIFTFRDQTSGAEGSLAITSTVLPLSIPGDTPVTIQATVWPVRKYLSGGSSGTVFSSAASYTKELVHLLSEYRINAVAGMGELQPDRYIEVVKYAFEELNFRQVRLPITGMYSRGRPMRRLYPAEQPSTDELVAVYREKFSKFLPLINNPAFRTRLCLKLWDEPEKMDYPDVMLIYNAAREAWPVLRLEISEEPSPELEDAADIWTAYIGFFDPAQVVRVHPSGGELWIYANKVHGIDHRPKGMRILGWLIWAYDLDGYLFWGVNWWEVDPWTTVSAHGKDFLKRGTLVYPDTKGRGVVTSLRLEAFRDGIEDMLLIQALEKNMLLSNDEIASLIEKVKESYPIQERYDHAPNPALLREEILNNLFGRYE